MQALNNLPNWIKFGLAIVVVTVTAVLGLNVDSLLLPKSSNLVEVGIVVQTSEGEPIEGVQIQFLSKGAPEPRLTNTDGYARIEIPSRSDIDVVLRKEGFKPIKRTIDLKSDPNRNRTYELEPLSSQPSPSPSPSASLKQTLSSYSNSKKTSNLICEQTLDREQFFFEIKNCEKLNSTLAFEFVIKNQGKGREFSLYSNGTRVFDDAGNENQATAVILGDRTWNSYSNTQLPYNTSIKAGIKFENVFLEGDKISLLEIQTSMFKIEFRDIPLSQ